MKSFRLVSLGCTWIILGLSGCGGSSSTMTTPEPEPAPQQAPPINQAKAFDGPLVKAGEAKVAQYLKNGVYSATREAVIVPFNDGAVPTPGIEAESGFSTTNTQEAGVDEADRIEYDGTYLYVATQPQWFDIEQQGASVRILQRNDDFSLTEVNVLSADKEAAAIDGLYLADDRLAVLRNDTPIYAFAEIAIAPWEPAEQKVTIDIYDVTQPASAVNSTQIEVDGWMITSRRIGDDLYLATAYTPHVEGIQTGSNEQTVLNDNYTLLQSTPVSELMPTVSIDGVEAPLVDAENCYIPAQADELDGFAQLVVLSKVNLQQPQQVESVCLSTFAYTLYMSEENMYLATDLAGDTGFHKISLQDMAYQASGSVVGLLGWRSAPNLRIDEQDGFLRVISSDYREEQPQHKLTVLEQQGDVLTPVAELPNANQPEPLGKPGEDVFAVRFIDDKAYVVTFERIDPLYVLDLSDNRQPLVAGSLEIPGFSSYLHPMDNGYLLGVGQSVSATELPVDGRVPVEPPTLDGVKLSLFDVRDPAAPIEVSTLSYAQSYTPVEFDYRALSVLNQNGVYQFAMPLEFWGQGTSDGGAASTSFAAAENRLLLLDVDTQSANATLNEVNQLSATPSTEVYVYAGNDRSVIHGQYVYYIHGNQVWRGQWSADSEVVGPF